MGLSFHHFYAQLWIFYDFLSSFQVFFTFFCIFCKNFRKKVWR